MREDPIPPRKGVKKRKLIAEAVDRIQVGDVRGDTWFGLFDEAGMIHLLKGMSGFGGATLFGESQSSGTWHSIELVEQAGNN